jgi:hypothetical protein
VDILPDDRALERELRLNQLYLAIISRYKDFIEEKEHVSIAELPGFVTPKAELVVKKADEIKSVFGAYNYDSHFYEASIDAFHSIKDAILDVSMPLQFWLTPEETLSFGIGDVLDRNTLLCSLLIALGNPSAKVLVYTKGGVRKVFTYYELGGKAYILDFDIGFKHFESREALIKSLSLDDESISYEFNDNMYVDIA